MRNAFNFIALAAGVVAVAVSCNKEIETPDSQEPIKLVIRAGAPETRTTITSDGNGKYTPSWSANDAIGVFFTNIEDTPTEFVNAEAGTTALFEPSNEITGVSGDQTLYAFYPLGAFQEIKNEKFRINVKDVQTPDALGTFDKSSDILVAKPYPGNISTIVADGGIIDLAFARLLSVVKITPIDATTTNPKALAGEYVKSVKIEYNGSSDNNDAPLTGRVALDLETGEFGDWSIKTYSASAGFGDNVFALNGSNAAYLLVNPISIASGKKVTFTVKTNKHDVSKEITLSNVLTFPAGNIATIALNIDDSWTIVDNTLDPNIIFQTPFYAAITSNTTYDASTHGDLGVVGSSKSTITYLFDGSSQLRNNSNKISADDASFYWCTSSTGLVIDGINVGTSQYFNLSFDRKVPSGSATLALTISNDGSHYFPITSTETVSITGTNAANNSYNFSIPSGEHTNLKLKFANSGSGITIDNVTLTKLTQAGESNKAVSFDVVAVDPTLVVSPSPVELAEGGTKQLTVTGTNGAITYQSNNPDVATVTSTGLVTAVAEGSTTISITSAATEEYNAGSTSVTVNVTAALTFETIEISESWSADLKNTQGNNAKFKDDGKNVWTVDETYGHKAANNATASSFYSPKFDMSGVSAGSITFAHTGNVTGTDYQSLGKAYYTLDNGANWTQISLSNPSNNWSWQTATIPSSVYAGETIQFRWDFQGNASKTWEVKDFAITVPVFRTITFTQPTETNCSFTVTVDGSAISSGASVEVGKTVTLAATAGSGYKFTSWSVSGATVNGNSATATFTVGDSNITVGATFTALANSPITLVALSSEEVNAGCSYTVSVDGNTINNNTSVQEGKTVTLSATTGTGYTFSSWTVYKTEDENTTVSVNNGAFEMPAYAVTVVAVFTSGQGPVKYFQKVTDQPTSFDDTYLFVALTNGVAVNGSLAASNMIKGGAGITISDNDGIIEYSEALENAMFTISSIDGGYSIYASGPKYIGYTGTSNNGLTGSTTPLVNTITWSEGKIQIKTKNNSNTEYRFGCNPNVQSGTPSPTVKYFKTWTTNYEDITLYRLVTSD